jgi:hypothetical protein
MLAARSAAMKPKPGRSEKVRRVPRAMQSPVVTAFGRPAPVPRPLAVAGGRK